MNLFGYFFANPKNKSIFALANAKIAQLVEHNLAKVRVAGSSPVFRSNGFARMVESVDTKDLKSFGYNTAVRVQVPLRVPRKALVSTRAFSFLLLAQGATLSFILFHV